MSNKEIAGLFNELASLMELHEENAFKIKSYANAYLNLRRLDIPLMEQDKEAWSAIPGIGVAIREKLEEIKKTGTFKALEEFREKTPEGIRQILRVKGLGPKKVKMIWEKLEIETPGELLYACHENRLIELKGFGPKIQQDIISNIEYFSSQEHLFLYSHLDQEAKDVEIALIELNKTLRIERTGALRRADITLESIDFICDSTTLATPETLIPIEPGKYLWKERIPVNIFYSGLKDFGYNQLMNTGGSDVFTKDFINKLQNKTGEHEEELFISNQLNYVPPECRDLLNFNNFDQKELIEQKDIRGVVHNHSKYSDGICSVEEMAKECIRLGYEYLVISDHSRSAFYANGLSIERVEMQWREIDALNNKLQPFKIYKSIESDILGDGSLDYPDDILEKFDLVIASIHSNLKMDEEKAMMRLIKAVESPYTTILGHPTGRLLLSRQGYPVDFKKLMDACVKNHVAIEINANPVRLDMDWKWISYAMEKGLMISVNPDSHNLRGIQDIQYGVIAGRKGGLLKNNCLNSMNISEFEGWIRSKNKF